MLRTFSCGPVMCEAMDDDDHHGIDESGYEEDDEGGAHIKKNRKSSRNSVKAMSKSSSRIKRPGLLRDSFVLKEHRWRINDPFVVDPTESFNLDALDVTKTALKAVECNMIEANSPIEDKFVVHIDENLAFFGVFDGHGGVEVADFCRILLISTIQSALYDERVLKETWTHEEALDAIANGLRHGFLKFDKMLEEKMPSSGSCALVTLLIGPYLFVANAGDSRALLVQHSNDRYSSIQLSDDQNCSNPAERERLLSEHPDEPDLFENNRIKGTLDPTRSFGDFKHKISSPEIIESMSTETSPWSPPYITAEPDIVIHRLIPKKDKYLIMASDGLWEKFSNSDVVDMVADAVKDRTCIPTRMIEKFISKTTGGLEEEKLAVLFAMNPRARRSLHDDVTILSIEFDHEILAQSDPDISHIFSKFEYIQTPSMTRLSNPKLVDISQLLSQIPHDSENSDYH